MRKFITILMMIVMLSMPGNMALAVKSGSGSGSGDNRGGFDANVTMEQALARPAFFVTIALAQIIIYASSFNSRFLVRPMSQRTLLTLVATGTLTTVFFLVAIVQYFRYITYFMFANPYFLQYGTANRVSSQVPELDDDVYSVAVPEVSTVIRKKAEESAPAQAPYLTDKQRAINAAVDRALRDPELADKYLEFASPEVREAVDKALENQFEFENRNRFTIEERWEGDFDAFGTPRFLRQ